MNLTRKRKRHQSRRGAVAVEFAIAVAVLIMVVFASVEFVRLNMLKHSVEHASYLAARKGIITGAKNKDVKKEAERHLAILGVTNAAVEVLPATIDDDTLLIEVSIDLPTSGNTWVAPLYFNGIITGRSRMLAERSAAKMSAALAATVPSP